MVKKKNKEGAERILKVVLILIGVLHLINSIMKDSSLLIGNIIGLAVAIACAEKCSKWAMEINKSPNLAYALGFFLSLVGLLFYWIYFLIIKKKKAGKRKKPVKKNSLRESFRKL